MPPTLEALEAGDPWPKPMIGQWMEIVNTFLAVNDVKKNLRFHLPLRLIEKRFEIPAHTLKNLIFFCPIICIPLALCGFRFKFWTLLCTYNYNGEKSTKKVIHSRVQKSNWIPRAEGKMKIIGQKKIKFFSGHRYISKHLFIRCKELWILSITIFFSFVAYSVSIILIEGFR